MNTLKVCKHCGSSNVKMVAYLDYNMTRDEVVNLKNIVNGTYDILRGTPWCMGCSKETEIVEEIDISPTEITMNDTVLYLYSKTLFDYSAIGCENIIIEDQDDGTFKCIIKEHTGGIFAGNSNIFKLEQLSELLTSCSSMFENVYNLCDIRGLVIPDSVTNCYCMFKGCNINSLDDVKLSKNTENMQFMFCNNNIKVIDGFKIPKSVKNICRAFEQNPIEDIKDFVLHDNIQNCVKLFMTCQELKNISGLTIPKHIEDYDSMFIGCVNLDETTLKVDGLSTRRLFK